MAIEDRTEKVYMCGVDWQHEIGAAMGGNTVHPSVEDLKKHRKCWKSCGIVEIEVKFVKWVEPQDFSDFGGKNESSD